MERKQIKTIPPSAAGIVHCLNQLAAEATSLGLPQSAVRIREALEIVAIEIAIDPNSDTRDTAAPEQDEGSLQARLALH